MCGSLNLIDTKSTCQPNAFFRPSSPATADQGTFTPPSFTTTVVTYMCLIIDLHDQPLCGTAPSRAKPCAQKTSRPGRSYCPAA
jgi:hypothetical protein